jgi:hypothetical protein
MKLIKKSQRKVIFCVCLQLFLSSYIVSAIFETICDGKMSDVNLYIIVPLKPVIYMAIGGDAILLFAKEAIAEQRDAADGFIIAVKSFGRVCW